MKKIVFLAGIPAIAAVFLLVINSCQKSSNNNNGSNNGLNSQPSAQATYDNQSGGVYKGSLTGSSGYFEVNLQSSRPYLIYQWTNPSGSIDSLFTTSLSAWQSGQAISKAVFQGADGSFFWFSVGANGSNPSIDSVHIPTHSGPVYAAVVKEQSTALVKIYQGTATVPGGANSRCVDATVNMWITGTSAYITYLGTNGNQGVLTGTVSGNQLPVTGGNDTGTLTISSDGNTVSGSVTGNSCTHSASFTRIF